MSESILLIGNSEKTDTKISELFKAWNITKIHNNPDIEEISKQEGKKNISVEQTHTAIKFLRQRPFEEKHKVLIIREAELLNTESQNALLKTLEEPPEYAKIILTTENHHSLLETVLSRCKKYFLYQEMDKSQNKELEEFLKSSLGQKLIWAAEESKKDKDEILQDLKVWLIALRAMTIKDVELVDKLKTLNQTYTDLSKTNVNTRLALEHLCLIIQS